MKARFFISAALNAILISFLANCYVLIELDIKTLFVFVPVFVLVNLLAGILIPFIKNVKLLFCQHGTILLYAFYISIILSLIYQILYAVKIIPDDYITFLWNLAVCVGVNFIVFWNGIICVYICSTQLGFKWRLIGLICGMIPIANLIALFCILKKTTNECFFEFEKDKINRARKDQQLCATKYPILLVHGVFFRDTKFFNYWGRVPKELETNGAKIFYGNHPSAASISDSAAELKLRIAEILEKTGAEKVNVIAHSKGGLDCRYAISKLGIGQNIASLTTINTPHRGCLFAESLLNKTPDDIKQKVANAYNFTLGKLGEPNADFLAAVNDLTDSKCKELDSEMGTPEGIFCQSVGSVLIGSTYGKFPLNFSYHLVRHYSGDNDGLVSEESFSWGEKYTLLKPSGKRGISHGDMIDLNRENIDGFDVREFYVNLVNDLKNRGL